MGARLTACLHRLYAETYEATARALASEDPGDLLAVSEMLEELRGPRSVVAHAAVMDALNEIPARPHLSVCRLRGDVTEECQDCPLRPAGLPIVPRT